MKFRETLIAPDGSIKVEYMEQPYKHSSLEGILNRKIPSGDDLDIQLPDLNFVHTYTTPDGTFVLIHQRL